MTITWFVVCCWSTTSGDMSSEPRKDILALADTDNFGQKVYGCAHMMLPYDLNRGGSITMTMPDGTVMYFRTFGGMVTYMQSNAMCS
jgi:hypothetical protein